MKALLAAASAAFLLSACAAEQESALALYEQVKDDVEDVSDETLTKGAQAIDGYCERVPASVREKLRDELNERTEKGDIHVDCEGDS